jgi:hypothetical protein
MVNTYDFNLTAIQYYNMTNTAPTTKKINDTSNSDTAITKLLLLWEIEVYMSTRSQE